MSIDISPEKSWSQEFAHWIRIEETKFNKRGRTDDNQEQDKDNLTIVQLNAVYSPVVCLAIANDLTTASNQQEVPWTVFDLPTFASTSHPTILYNLFGTGCRYLGKCLTEHLEHFFIPRTANTSLESQLNG